MGMFCFVKMVLIIITVMMWVVERGLITMDQTWPFAVNDTFTVEVYNPGSMHFIHGMRMVPIAECKSLTKVLYNNHLKFK